MWKKTYRQYASDRCYDDNYDTGHDSAANALNRSRSSHNGDNSKNDDNDHADQLNQAQPSELSNGKMNEHQAVNSDTHDQDADASIFEDDQSE